MTRADEATISALYPVEWIDAAQKRARDQGTNWSAWAGERIRGIVDGTVPLPQVIIEDNTEPMILSGRKRTTNVRAPSVEYKRQFHAICRGQGTTVTEILKALALGYGQGTIFHRPRAVE